MDQTVCPTTTTTTTTTTTATTTIYHFEVIDYSDISFTISEN